MSSKLPAVPARRHDPSMQNFIYLGQQGMSGRRKSRRRLARLARKVCNFLRLQLRNLRGTNQAGRRGALPASATGPDAAHLRAVGEVTQHSRGAFATRSRRQG